MHRIERSAYVMHSARQMYELVNDIEAYPEFVPWCVGARILIRQGGSAEGELEIKKGPMHFHLVTHNRLMPYERIEMNLLQGTFKHLEGDWQFKALHEHACKTTIKLEFELARVMDFALEIVLGSVANAVLQAFCARADHIYEK